MNWRWWLVWMLHYWNYTTIAKYDDHEEKRHYRFFALSWRRRNAPKHVEPKTLVASFHPHTQLYTLGEHRFTTMNDMLDAILTNALDRDTKRTIH